MNLTWKLPGEPSNPAAIARMRQHFPKPAEPMPEAWFMGELNFYAPEPNEDAKFLCYAVEQIRGGIVNFSEVPYVPVWKAWFHYLLPDLILRANEPESLNAYDLNILATTITTFFSIYPSEIEEMYTGFRDDVVSTLGTRAIPQHLARDAKPEQVGEDRLFTDIWNLGEMIQSYGFPSLDEVKSSFLFCLKYLPVGDIEVWVASLFEIDSPQWYLQMIFLISSWTSILKMAETVNPPEKNSMRQILDTSHVLNTIWTPPFKTFDEFIPSPRVNSFNRILAERFSFGQFVSWREEILTHLNATPFNRENGFYLTHILENELRECEMILFLDRIR